MGDDSDRPLGALLHSWFTLVTGCISLWWFLSEQALVEKVVAGGVVAIVLNTIVVAHVARRRERVKHAAEVRRLRSEVRRLKAQIEGDGVRSGRGRSTQAA